MSENKNGTMMKVYYFKDVEDWDILIHETKEDILETLRAWSGAEVRSDYDAETLEDLDKDIAECKKAIETDDSYIGEFYSVWVDERPREWFEGLLKKGGYFDAQH